MSVNPKFYRVDLLGTRLGDYGYMNFMHPREARKLVEDTLIHGGGVDPSAIPEINLIEIPPGEVLEDMGRLPERGRIYWDFFNFAEI